MPRKIILLILVLSLAVLSGCGANQNTPLSVNTDSVNQEQTAQVSTDGWSSELINMDLNYVEHHSGYNNTTWDVRYGAEGNYNINGKAHEISVMLGLSDETYDGYDKMTVTIDGTSTEFESYCYGLEYAAAAELYGSEILLFTATDYDDSWRELTVFRYDGSKIEPMNFDVHYYSYNPALYGVSNTCDVNIELLGGSDFQMWKKTASLGMWNVKKTYSVKDNVITENSQDKYETDTKAFLTPDYDYGDVYDYMKIDSREEFDRLSEGYVLCHKSYDFLKEGTYFTMLYDDEKNHIYVRTETGEEGWITLPQDYSEREDISRPLLYLAG